MLREAFRHWKKNPKALTIIVAGYVICTLVVSLMISSMRSYHMQAMEDGFGRFDNRKAIFLYTDGSKDFNYDSIELVKSVGQYGKVDILQLGFENVTNGKATSRAQIVPTYFKTKPDWQPAVLKGRNLTPEESMSSDKKVVIGKKLAEKLGITDLNAKLNFYGMEYEVIGIIGLKYYDSSYKEVLYMPLGSMPKEYLEAVKGKLIDAMVGRKTLNLNVLLRVKQEELSAVLENLSQKYKDNVFHYDIQANNAGFYNESGELGNVVKMSIPIIAVALINVVVISLFWIMERRKEISIKKVLGATDEYIKRSVQKDILAVAAASAIFAILIQLMLYILVEPVLADYNYSLNLSWINFAAGMLVCLGIGYVSALVPVEKTLKMNPADALRIE